MEFSSPFATRPSSTKLATPSVASDGAGSVTKRLGSELMSLMMASSPGISAFPKSDANLFEWAGTIEGPASTPYAGLIYKINITFPPNYPFASPSIKFDASTPCYHPNFDLQGNICLDILQDKWSAVYSVSTVLLSLQSLLGEPNNASPLNNDAAALWGRDEEFKAQVLKHFRMAEGGASQ